MLSLEKLSTTSHDSLKYFEVGYLISFVTITKGQCYIFMIISIIWIMVSFVMNKLIAYINFI